MSAKRVLVSGGTGFVGAGLVRRLLAAGHRVELLVRPQHDPWRLAGLLDDVQRRPAPLEEPQAVAAAVREAAPEWVFHLAAQGNYPDQRDPGAMVATNLAGTIALLEASLAGEACQAFVHTGSSSEYGYQDQAPAEGQALEPNSYYAVTKAAATHACRLRGRESGRRVVTLRLYSVYGPWERPTRLIPTLIREGLAGRLPPLVAPDTARDFVYLDDAVEALLLAAETPQQEPGAIYNVGSGTMTTLRQVVDLARAELGLSQEPEWGSMPRRRWDTGVWVADPRAAAAALGWRASTSLAEGFRRTLAWARQDPRRVALG